MKTRSVMVVSGGAGEADEKGGIVVVAIEREVERRTERRFKWVLWVRFWW